MRALVAGFAAPLVAAGIGVALVCLLPAAGVPAVFGVPGPNWSDKLGPYQILDTLLFHGVLVGGLVAGAVTLNLRSSHHTPWLWAGEVGAFALVGALVPAISWWLVEGLPANCAGRVPPVTWSLGLSIGLAVILAASTFVGTVGFTRGTAVSEWITPVLAVPFAGTAVLLLFNEIDNVVVERLFYHC